MYGAEMTQYITTYKSPFWDDPSVRSTLDTSIPRLPPRPEHLKPWMISSLSGANMSSKTCKEIQASKAVKYLGLARKYGAQYGIDPYITLAYAKHESGFNPTIYNIGCRKRNPLTYATKCTAGLTQLPYRYYSKKVDRPEDLVDPATNLRLFSQMFAFLKKKFGTDQRALIAANWGYGRMAQHVKGNPKYRTISPSSIRYGNSVRALRRRYASCLGGVAGSLPGGGLQTALLLGAAVGLGYLLYRRLKK